MKIISFPSPHTRPAEAEPAPVRLAPAAPAIIVDLDPLKESLRAVDADLQQWKTGRGAVNDHALTEIKRQLDSLAERIAALEQQPATVEAAAPVPVTEAPVLESPVAAVREEPSSPSTPEPTNTPMPVVSPFVLTDTLPIDFKLSLWGRLRGYLNEPASKSNAKV